MTIASDKTVRELIIENPASARVFEKLGIDYCCGGDRCLREACQSANLNLDQVVDSLEKADEETSVLRNSRNWQLEPMATLIEHIQNTHHKYTRDEIARLEPLWEKVCSVHGKSHPELFEAREIFHGLAQELNAHLMKEEIILFPYIRTLEAAHAGKRQMARAPFGSVRNPVSMMEHEHDSAGNALRAMNEATKRYSAPDDACASYRALYEALATFEANLHQHIHLENNILFPRAIAMESAR
jgi:regulator of cell morphogenesis and NO signaling